MIIIKSVLLPDPDYCKGCFCYHSFGGDLGAMCKLYNEDLDLDFPKGLSIEDYNKWRRGEKIYPYKRLKKCKRENEIRNYSKRQNKHP